MTRSSQQEGSRNWDYIIIGAGSAGCALASELVESNNKTVLLLEAGGSDRSPFIRFPAGSLRLGEKYDWGYRSHPDPSRNGATERWDRARVLGGCSSVNSTVFVRGAASDFDRWADQHRLSGWSAQEVNPIFSEMESSDQRNVFRGHSGPLHVRTVKRRHPATEAFLESAIASGYRFNEDYNGETQEGVAYAQLSQRFGLRCSAADAFLRPLLGKSKNLQLLLNAFVHRTEITDGRANAVLFARNGAMNRERAKDIIVCAGAINSPALLMHSGIGAAQELQRLGVKTTLDLPGVGKNLKDHPRITMVYKTHTPTNNLTGGILQKLRIAATFALTREGPIANIFEGVAFLRSVPIERVPDLQLHFTPLGLPKEQGKITLASYPSLSVMLNKNHPLSSGQIRLASNDPHVAPLIECRLLEHEADVDTLVRGIAMVRRIMQAGPVANLVKEEVAPGPQVVSVSDLKNYVRNQTEITFHFAGTCRMGTGADAVVGPDLRVRGTHNLWVADASIMPDMISGNTNAVCMMIGMKLGKQFRMKR